VGRKTPGREMGGVGVRRLRAGAKNSLERERIWGERGAEMRSRGRGQWGGGRGVAELVAEGRKQRREGKEREGGTDAGGAEGGGYEVSGDGVGGGGGFGILDGFGGEDLGLHEGRMVVRLVSMQ